MHVNDQIDESNAASSVASTEKSAIDVSNCSEYEQLAEDDGHHDKQEGSIDCHDLSSLEMKHNGECSVGDASNKSLSSLVDAIRIMCRRDSEWYLKNRSHIGTLSETTARTSPWELDSVIQSPMVSSPHVMNFPDLNKRREYQIQKHELKVMEEKRIHEEERLEHVKKRQRAISLGDDMNADREDFIVDGMKVEEDQWERKRKQKLKSVIHRSVSELSFASSKKSTYSPTMDMVKDLKEEFAKFPTPPLVSVMYGIVNAVIVLPVLMSFGNIIFHDDFFHPYLPVLIKLTVISGIIHQLCFSTFSTLPFAVGSVQDAGLIFLSTIASNIVHFCKERGYDDEVILATTLVGLSLFTAVLGAGLVIIGRLKLAQYVQKLPTPVVGGYLAFIGFFCGQSALSLLSATQVSGILGWRKFVHRKSLYLITPGLIGGCGIYTAVRKIKHMAVLPIGIFIILVTFYAVLHIFGMSLNDAKDIGLMMNADAPPSWIHTWDYIRLDKVIWAAFPGQIATVFSMIFVVALSSSLDIAAIDLEVPKPLAYNHELKMIGVSNLISGLTGGYTGSYIFSQSIFSLRAGIRSRLAGYVTALLQTVAILIPVSILTYVPNFVFASLLIMICIDLMIEWLWDVRKKLSKVEYTATIATFCFIQFLGVEYGIATGVVFYLVLTTIPCNTYYVAATAEETTHLLHGDAAYRSTEEYEVGLSLEETPVIR